MQKRKLQKYHLSQRNTPEENAVSHFFFPIPCALLGQGVVSPRCCDCSCRGRKRGQSSGRIIRESFPSFLQGSTNIFRANFSAGHREEQTLFLTKHCDTQARIQGAGKTSTSGIVPQPCRLRCSCGLCHPVQHLLHNQNEEIVLRT